MTETEKKIEVIKWSCGNGYAEGFGITKWSDVYETFSCSLYEHSHEIEWWLNDDLFFDFGWPHFLTRTIEGINREEKGYFVTDDGTCLMVRKWGNFEHEYAPFDYENTPIDQAKLAAIIYVMEHSEEKV